MHRISVREIRLHRGAQRVHMAVGVSAREHVLAAREGPEIVTVEKESTSQRTVALTGTTPPGEIEILRERVRLVPRVRDIRMRSRRHLRPREGFLRQVW